MIYLLFGLILFFAPHVFASIRMRGPGDVKDKLGPLAYMAGFALISGAGLVLLIWGYAQARASDANIVFWTAPEWTRHIILAVMPFAMMLLISAYAPTGYIKKAAKHPMVLAVKLWAAVHLLYNGDLASVLLFDAFLAYGVLSRIMAKRRGDNGPVDEKANALGDVVSVAGGAAVYIAFIFGLHTMLIGVPAASFG